MRLEFENINDNLELDDNFRISISPYKPRIGIQQRYGKPGGVVTGDEKTDPRTIDIKYDLTNSNITDDYYIETLNNLIAFFRPELEPFYLNDIDNDRRTEIRLREANDVNIEGLEYIIGNNRLSFSMVDAFWEDRQETEVNSPSGGLNTGETIQVNNNSLYECSTIIKIRPYQLNTDLLIKNNTNGQSFIIGNESFFPSTEFIINGIDGTIFLNNGVSLVEASSSFADGSGFISLDPGINEIEYSSAFGAVDLDILFRKRYVF